MTDSFERKPSSSDLLSRLKTRKVLGVGQSSGTTTVSKVTQILGQKTDQCEELPILSCVLYWNYFIAFSLLFIGTTVLLCGDICGHYLVDYLIGDPTIGVKIKERYQVVISKQRRTCVMHLGVPMFCIGSIMLYSLILIRSGGSRIAQFSSTLYFILTWIVVPMQTKEHAGLSWFALGTMFINTMCHLHVLFPHWTVWSQMKRRLALVGDKCTVTFTRLNQNASAPACNTLRTAMKEHSVDGQEKDAITQTSSSDDGKQHSE